MWTAASSGLAVEASPLLKSMGLRCSLPRLPVTVSCDSPGWASEPEEARRYCSRFFTHYVAFSLFWPYRAGSSPKPTAVKVLSSNHWTTREVPPWLSHEAGSEVCTRRDLLVL